MRKIRWYVLVTIAVVILIAMLPPRPLLLEKSTFVTRTHNWIPEAYFWLSNETVLAPQKWPVEATFRLATYQVKTKTLLPLGAINQALGAEMTLITDPHDGEIGKDPDFIVDWALSPDRQWLLWSPHWKHGSG